MIPTRKYIRNLHRTTPRARGEYLRLDMNEGMPGLPVKLVRKVFSKITPEYLSMYPEYKTLKKAIARHNGIDEKNICLASGSDGAIKYIFEAYITPGDNVLLTDPTFAMYPIYCAIFGAMPVMVQYGDDFSFPVKKFCDMIDNDIKIAVVVNPNNPTGTALKMPELIMIIKRAAEKNVLIIVDEAYFYFCPVTAINLIKDYDNLIVLRTFSKLCALASLRIGYAAASPEIIIQLKKVRPTFDVNGIGAIFAEELLNAKGVIKGLTDEMSKGAGYLAGKLRQRGIEYRRGAANFILIKCPRESSEEFVAKLDKEKVLVGGNFRQDFLKDYIRVTISDIKNMKKFWDIFIRIWDASDA